VLGDGAVATLDINFIQVSGLTTVFASPGEGNLFKIRAHTIVGGDPVCTKGEFLQFSSQTLQMDVDNIFYEGANLFSISCGETATINISTIAGNLTDGYLFKMKSEESHVTIKNLFVTAGCDTDMFKICDGYHYIDVDYIDTSCGHFNSLLTVEGGKAYANLKKISGEMRKIGSLINVGCGKLYFTAQEINPKLKHVDDGMEALITLNGDGVGYFNVEKFCPTFGECAQPPIFKLSDSSSLYSRCQMIYTAGQIVDDSTCGIVDFEVVDCTSENATSIVINSTHIVRHTYRGTYRYTGSTDLPVISIPATIACGTLILNNVILVTTGCKSITSANCITINNYNSVMASADIDENITMLTPAFYVNSSIY